MATASATVFTLYYGNTTTTVRTADVQLIAGSDASGSCTAYPCSTVSVSTTKDFATIGISFFPSATNTPQPATYYTNLTLVKNAGSSSHTINSVAVSSITGATNLGSITVYFCTSQTDTPASSSSCASFAITSSTGGSLTGNSILPYTIAAGATAHIEVVAYALSTAAASSTTTFTTTIS